MEGHDHDHDADAASGETPTGPWQRRIDEHLSCSLAPRVLLMHKLLLSCVILEANSEPARYVMQLFTESSQLLQTHGRQVPAHSGKVLAQVVRCRCLLGNMRSAMAHVDVRGACLNSASSFRDEGFKRFCVHAPCKLLLTAKSPHGMTPMNRDLPQRTSLP